MTERVVASVFGGFQNFVVYAPYCEVETRSWDWGTRSLGWEVSLLRRLADTHGWVLGLAWVSIVCSDIELHFVGLRVVQLTKTWNVPNLIIWISRVCDIYRPDNMWFITKRCLTVTVCFVDISSCHCTISSCVLIPLLLNRPALLKPHGHQPEGSSGNIGFRWRTRSRETSQIFGGADSTKWVRQIRRWDVLTYWTTRVCLGYG